MVEIKGNFGACAGTAGIMQGWVPITSEAEPGLRTCSAWNHVQDMSVSPNPPQQQAQDACPPPLQMTASAPAAAIPWSSVMIKLTIGEAEEVATEPGDALLSGTQQCRGVSNGSCRLRWCLCRQVAQTLSA